MDVQFCLEKGERIAAFLASLVVLGIDQAVFYFAVCDDDLGIFQFYRSIFII